MFAGGDPVPLGAGVDLEDMGPGAEDGLLPGGRSTQNCFCDGDFRKRRKKNAFDTTALTKVHVIM